jgi:endonuclease I
MDDVRIIQEWQCELFHRRVMELESQGYTARRESYRITPEMNPETGEIVHLYTIELQRQDANPQNKDRP